MSGESPPWLTLRAARPSWQDTILADGLLERKISTVLLKIATVITCYTRNSNFEDTNMKNYWSVS